MAPITLYHYWRSSCSWRVRWALEIKKVNYKAVAVNLLQGHQLDNGYLRKNSSAQVPCIAIGNNFYSESLAIVEWIEEAFQGPSLLPRSPMDRLRVRELTFLVAAGIQPLQNLKVQQFVSNNTNFDGKDFARKWIADGFKAFEKKLEIIGAATYCVGGHLTIADLALIPQCYNALRFGVPLYRYPLIKGIYDRCMARDDCKSASPENNSESGDSA